MNLEIFYFDIKHAIREPDWIIAHTGGLKGQREIQLLSSALDNIQNDSYYPTFEEKLKHLIIAVNQFHPFYDGNKRSSLVLGAYFLELNGYDYCIDRFIFEMENIVVWLADGKINNDLLLDIVKSIINEDDFDESIKLRLFENIGF